jgi:transcriptional regulator with XRE-family HTH domain
MKTIQEQIAQFLAETGLSAYRLAKEAGLNRSYVSRLKNGRQRNAYSKNADALRLAMKNLDPETARKVLA